MSDEFIEICANCLKTPWSNCYCCIHLPMSIDWKQYESMRGDDHNLQATLLVQVINGIDTQMKQCQIDAETKQAADDKFRQSIVNGIKFKPEQYKRFRQTGKPKSRNAARYKRK